MLYTGADMLSRDTETGGVQDGCTRAGYTLRPDLGYRLGQTVRYDLGSPLARLCHTLLN